MLQEKFQSSTTEKIIQMEIWENPYPPSFKFQQYRCFDESERLPYEALAILKNPDGTPLENALYFDKVRTMDGDWQIAVDKFLVPMAIKAAAEKKRLPVAVNLHLVTLFEPGFLQEIERVITGAGLKKRDVMLEIVEPHIPTPEQAEALKEISSRTKEDGFTLIIDDHDFLTGEERLRLLAPYCEMVKIEMGHAPDCFDSLRRDYPHLKIVLERVTFNDRESVFETYPGVLVQGI